MAELGDLLSEIETQIYKVEIQAAQDQMEHLLRTIGDEELRVWEIDIRRTIDAFLPSRRRVLTAALEARLQRVHEVTTHTVAVGAHADIEDLLPLIEQQLAALSHQHIFQWATWYRDTLGVLFEQLFDATRMQEGTPDEALDAVVEAVAHHSTDIFSKGFAHFSRTSSSIESEGVQKGLTGLQRFLDLPLEFYSLRVSNARDQRDSAALRWILSSIQVGILLGFSRVSFVGTTGAVELAAYPGAWAHVLPFLTSQHLLELSKALPDGSFVDGLDGAMKPLAAAFDKATKLPGDSIALPSLSQFNAVQSRFEITLTTPSYGVTSRSIDVHVYLDSGHVSRPALREAARREVAMIIAPVRPDLKAELQGDERLAQILVDWSDSPMTVINRTVTTFEYSVYRHQSARLASQALKYNFAEDFPLHNPFLTRYVHVYRSSVRELARAFERRNGVRMWCSVRRSGKTTSCIDLGSSGSDSSFVIQTCAATNQIPQGTFFYERLLGAIESGSQLRPTFFRNVVEQCLAGSASGSRTVFVLDEYETLFGQLRAAVRRDDTTRFTIVQPLLDQMVGFTQSNLLVFLGQQPTAHFSFMEQNQLSAYVEQDRFPLFRRNHGSLTEDEFSELISRVFADRAGFDGSFADEVFAETSGHPYLTVKLLTVFVDHLIERGTPAGSLFFTKEDFAEFRVARLRPRDLSQHQAFAFFREAIAEATSKDAKNQVPWLFCVYTCLRELTKTTGSDMAMFVEDFTEMFEKFRLDAMGYSAVDLLGTACQANFFREDDGIVEPGIPILARLAAVTRARVAR